MASLNCLFFYRGCPSTLAVNGSGLLLAPPPVSSLFDSFVRKVNRSPSYSTLAWTPATWTLGRGGRLRCRFSDPLPFSCYSSPLNAPAMLGAVSAHPFPFRALLRPRPRGACAAHAFRCETSHLGRRATTAPRCAFPHCTKSSVALLLTSPQGPLPAHLPARRRRRWWGLVFLCCKIGVSVKGSLEVFLKHNYKYSIRIWW